MNKQKILVIDDNRHNLEMAVLQLSDQYEITTADSYDKAEDLLRPRVNYNQVPHEYEIVLCDLLMPPSREGVMPECWSPKEQPVGIFLALYAAASGAKKVVLFTDANHHNHVASHALDMFHFLETRCTLHINGCKVVMTNDFRAVHSFMPNDLTKEVEYEAPGSVRVKDWKMILEEYKVCE